VKSEALFVKRLDSGLRRNDGSILRKADAVAERTLNTIEGFLDSPALKRVTWAVLILSAIYFGPVIFNIFNR
jgi:hypothetical protein